jgi:hypothetical protein
MRLPTRYARSARSERQHQLHSPPPRRRWRPQPLGRSAPACTKTRHGLIARIWLAPLPPLDPQERSGERQRRDPRQQVLCQRAVPFGQVCPVNAPFGAFPDWIEAGVSTRAATLNARGNGPDPEAGPYHGQRDSQRSGGTRPSRNIPRHRWLAVCGWQATAWRGQRGLQRDCSGCGTDRGVTRRRCPGFARMCQRLRWFASDRPELNSDSLRRMARCGRGTGRADSRLSRTTAELSAAPK